MWQGQPFLPSPPGFAPTIMAAMRPQVPPSDPMARYTDLAAAPRTVLRLKSLVFLPTGKMVFLDCLAKSGLRAPDGKAWSPRSLNPVLDQLAAQGLLTDDGACPPALLHPVAVDAMAAGDGAALAEAVRRAFPVRRSGLYGYGQQLDADALFRLLRLAVYANDEAGFVTHRDLHNKERAPARAVDLLAPVFAGPPLAPDWLAGRGVPIQLALLEAKLSVLLETGVPGPGLPELVAHYRAQEGRPGFAAVADVLQPFDLLAGDLPALRRGRDAAAPGTGRLSLDGALAFLDNRNDEALDHYRAALKGHRKEAGKRKAFLRGPHGLFFLMALLRAGPAAHTEMQATLAAALAARTPETAAFTAMQALLWLAQGLDARARELAGQLRAAASPRPLAAACLALAEHALDAGITRRHRAALIERFGRLKDTLPLPARMIAEVLLTVVPNPAPFEAFLAETPLGVAFTELIPVRQPWERALESLDAFLAAGAPKSGAAAPARKGKRLAWFVDPDTHAVEVAEQTAKGRDGWSDGRAVAMKRLHERDPRLDYLTEQDRLALRSIRKETHGWYDEATYGFDTARTIPALVGHPAVFDARHRSRPLELVPYPLELVVTEGRGGYHVALSHTAEGPDVFLEAETPTRYRVIEFPQRLLPLQEILGRGGLSVPKAARDRIVALARQEHPALPIRAEIAVLAAEAPDGQAEPVIQLVPGGEGMRLTLVVRPFGADGPAFIAGLGGRSVLAVVGGQQRRVNRDLPRELAERAALVAACPALRDRLGTDTHEAAIDDAEGALELLEELRSFAGPVSVEWPEGRKIGVVPVTPDKLKLRVRQDRDWFAVEGTVAVDADQVLDMRFLLDRLDRAKGRFVPLDDGRFIALTRQLQAQL